MRMLVTKPGSIKGKVLNCSIMVKSTSKPSLNRGKSYSESTLSITLL